MSYKRCLTNLLILDKYLDFLQTKNKGPKKWSKINGQKINGQK